MKRDKLETKIQADIEAALGAEPDLLLLRNSVGKARFYTDDGKTFHVPYGLGVGSPDLVALLRVLLPNQRAIAAWLCLEVKAPEGTVDPEQLKCHAIWRTFGARVYVVRSVADAKAALADAREFVS